MTDPSKSRRSFLRTSAALSMSGASSFGRALDDETAAKAADPIREFLRPYVLDREVLDGFLDPRARVWARFDPTYGYLLRNSFIRDGVDGSSTLARYESAGHRYVVNFRDRPCRLNTYGDSFTQGHQVSDGETWQEVLAAHFCEPIRNYGVGGFGVYQAARRLMEVEATDLGAEFLIFNIWGDDHFRSVYAFRRLTFPPNAIVAMNGPMFHANPWVHARLDPATRELIDRPNPCPDPESLRRLCDLDGLVEAFGGDDLTHLLLAIRTARVVEPDRLAAIAKAVQLEGLDWSTPLATRLSASALLHALGVEVGMRVIDRVHAFARERKKRLLVLLSYPQGSVWHACQGTPEFNSSDNVDWHPARFKEFLKQRGIPFVDTIQAHVDEFRGFKISAKEYVDRYYIGHYNPRGNHFFAYAVKDAIRRFLDPEPAPYRTGAEAAVAFDGYLPG
ncbi:MAG: hypothetical protein SFX72_04670 [Isosphaeraceae bacterium]|nr:hypothetical protein [Isosphaeraceae bacterium]